MEIGEEGKTRLLDILYQQFGDETFADIQTAIEDGTLTKEQIDEMREEITEQMEEILGPLQYLLVDIPGLSQLEDAAGDLVFGGSLEELREKAANIELNESLFENVFEAH